MGDVKDNLGVMSVKDIPNKVLTIPNFFTLLRIILLPPLLWALSERAKIGNCPAVLIGAGMITSDLLDGWLARKMKQFSRIGWILDPVFDKVIVISIAVFFALSGEIPYWVVIIIVCRDLAILIFGIHLLTRGMVPRTNIFGRLSPLMWSVSFVLLVVGLKSIAWVFIIIAITMSVFSAGIYYGEYRKALER